MSKTNAVASIRQCFNNAQSEMAKASKEFPWTNPGAYVAWLTDTYCYANHTTRILAGIGYKLPLEHTKLSNRFVAHAAEEKGHERLLENDVKAFGLDIKDIQPTTLGTAYHQSLYYWLTAGNPIGIFGWVLSLEGFAITEGPRLYEVCSKAFGPKATSFLKVHSLEDVDHVDKAFSILENLNSDECQMVESALTFQARLYANLLNNIAADSKILKQNIKKAA